MSKSRNKRISDYMPDSAISVLIMFVVLAVIIAVCGWILWLAKTPFTLHSPAVWWTICIGLTIAAIVSFNFFDADVNASPFWLILPIGAAILWVAFIIAGITSSNMVNANKWYSKVEKMVTVVEGENGGDCFPDLLGENNDTSKLPLVGIPEALKMAETEMGAKPSLGSRFKLLESQVTTQNIKNDIFYVVPLEPRSIFTWDSDTGNEGYFIINRNNRNLVFNEESLFTTEQAPFGDNAKRIIYNYMRKNNIGGRITDISPEVNDDGEFFFIATVYDTIGINGFNEVTGIVELNAKTKKCEFYDLDNIPEYVDRVYPESFFKEYARIYGAYAKGWGNSFIKKIGVIEPTADLDVVYIDGVCYYYTGMRNKVLDTAQKNASNGIMMMNSRTGEITYYVIKGISEKGAQEAIEGKVRNMQYSAGYPLPLKVGGVESYFMLLRDINNNFAGYAFVAYGDYQKYGFGETLVDAQTAYMKSLSTHNTTDSLANKELTTISGTITDIGSEVVEGTTTYYVKIAEKDCTFVFNSTLDFNIVFAEIGAKIEISYVESENNLIPAVKVKIR